MSSKFYKACTCARHPEMHEKQRLCEITGFNLFLGEVQRRLFEEGYDPPVWPDPSIRDQGDLDSALDSCTQWCKDRLDNVSATASTDTIIERVRHACVKSGVNEKTMGAICHEIRHGLSDSRNSAGVK